MLISICHVILWLNELFIYLFYLSDLDNWVVELWNNWNNTTYYYL